MVTEQRKTVRVKQGGRGAVAEDPVESGANGGGERDVGENKFGPIRGWCRGPLRGYGRKSDSGKTAIRGPDSFRAPFGVAS